MVSINEQLHSGRKALHDSIIDFSDPYSLVLLVAYYRSSRPVSHCLPCVITVSAEHPNDAIQWPDETQGRNDHLQFPQLYYSRHHSQRPSKGVTSVAHDAPMRGKGRKQTLGQAHDVYLETGKVGSSVQA